MVRVYIKRSILHQSIPQLPAKYVGSRGFKCHFMMKSTQVNYWFQLKSGDCILSISRFILNISKILSILGYMT